MFFDNNKLLKEDGTPNVVGGRLFVEATWEEDRIDDTDWTLDEVKLNEGKRGFDSDEEITLDETLELLTVVWIGKEFSE